MGKRLPRLTAREAVVLIERHGFRFVRQSGSHRIFRNTKGTRITIPVHPGTVLHPKLVKSILKDAELTVDDV